MEPIIQIDSPLDSVTFTGTNIAGGFIYDNKTLAAWYRLPTPAVKLNKRPNAHGTYKPDQIFTGEARIPFSGKFFGSYAGAADDARNRLAALFSDGFPVMVTVTDSRGPSSRLCFVTDYQPEWMPDENFSYDLELAAPDPRRYGTLKTPSTGLRTESSGLVWPLGTAPSGLFWDWGTPGNSGRVSFANLGNTTSYPAFIVGAGGSLTNGFVITEVPTGRTLIYPVDTAGGAIRLDSRTGRATVGSSDVTGNLSRAEWFAVPRGAIYEYQFATLGATTGAPTMQLNGADASL
jgi:hypothetical protein